MNRELPNFGNIGCTRMPHSTQKQNAIPAHTIVVVIAWLYLFKSVTKEKSKTGIVIISTSQGACR